MKRNLQLTMVTRLAYCLDQELWKASSTLTRIFHRILVFFSRQMA